MKASELIEALQLLVAVQGDRDVFFNTTGCYYVPQAVYADELGSGEIAFWIDENPKRSPA